MPQGMEQKTLRRIGIIMNILMGFSLSLGLSLIGNACSGHFSIQQWLVSFAASFLLSLVIGFCIPVRKIAGAACKTLDFVPFSAESHAMDSLVSDIFYTPLITLLMIYLAYRGAVSHGAPVSFLPMFVESLVISMLAGFVLIYVLQPVFLRLLEVRAPSAKEKPASHE